MYLLLATFSVCRNQNYLQILRGLASSAGLVFGVLFWFYVIAYSTFLHLLSSASFPLVLMGVLGGTFATFFFRDSALAHLEGVRLARLTRCRSVLTGAEFLDAFMILRRQFSTLRFARHVRGNVILNASREEELALEDLLSAAQNDRRCWLKSPSDPLRLKSLQDLASIFEQKLVQSIPRADSPQESLATWIGRSTPNPSASTLAHAWESDVFRSWYRKYVDPKRFRLALWTPELVDEISQLLEQVRNRRTD